MQGAGAGLWTSDPGGGGPPPPPAAPPTTIIYRPGGVTAAPVYATWAETYAAAQATEGPIAIAIDAGLSAGVAPIPPGTYDLEARTEIKGAAYAFPQATVLELADGARLLNLSAIGEGITIRLFATLAPALGFTSAQWLIGLFDGGNIQNQGTQPAIDAVAGTFGAVGLYRSGGYSNAPNGPPIVRLDAGASVAFDAFDRPILALTPAGELASSLAIGNGTIYYQHDATWPGTPPSPNFTGAVGYSVTFDTAAQTSFQDSMPLLGASDVQAAIDALKGGAIAGPANALAYYSPTGGSIGGDAALTAAPIDQFGRPQILDRRQGAPGFANCVFRQGGWQVDGDPVNQSGDGLVIYGPAPNGLQDGANGAFARVKWDRYAIRLVITGTDVGYGFRVDLTELYFKDDTGARTFSVTRATGQAKLKEGANRQQGIAALGAPGLILVASTLVTANTRIMLTAQDGGTVPAGSVYVAARVPGASFSIASTAAAADAGVLVAWQLWEPV